MVLLFVLDEMGCDRCYFVSIGSIASELESNRSEADFTNREYLQNTTTIIFVYVDR